MQDGPEAGQTVAHVHLHIIPRRGGDFARNDDVYQGIEEPARVRRTEEAMAAEAVLMREAVAEQVVMSRAEDLAREHFEKYGVDESHGIAHALKVLSNCNQALFFEKERRNTSDRLATMLAALLHDADDRKYFGDEASLKLLNARRIAAEAGSFVARGGDNGRDDFFGECQQKQERNHFQVRRVEAVASFFGSFGGHWMAGRVAVLGVQSSDRSSHFGPGNCSRDKRGRIGQSSSALAFCCLQWRQRFVHRSFLRQAGSCVRD